MPGPRPHFQIRNATRDCTLAARAELADSFWRRGIGLIGRRDWSAADGLIITPARSIHTCFMHLPIDVIHLDRNGRVCRLVAALPPWRFGPLVWSGRVVIELPAGTLSQTGTQIGDTIAWAVAD